MRFTLRYEIKGNIRIKENINYIFYECALKYDAYPPEMVPNRRF